MSGNREYTLKQAAKLSTNRGHLISSRTRCMFSLHQPGFDACSEQIEQSVSSVLASIFTQRESSLDNTSPGPSPSILARG